MDPITYVIVAAR